VRAVLVTGFAALVCAVPAFGSPASYSAAWLAQARCIHLKEGPWRANTGNGYFGGLQMSLRFQRVLAPELVRRKGTADNWTAIEQMWVAERAVRRGYGFTPWPRSARVCGVA